ncbi:MAG: TlpA disulfide reductase family protein [Thiobacillus sp.]|nr:TlpA disulfide reductase family protein [Thiobacillus sp.]
MNKLKRWAGQVAVLGLLFGLPAAGVAAELPPLSHSLTKLTPKPAPALKLNDMRGAAHDLSQLKGRVVLINFWATWCPPCRREMPSMERLTQQLKGEAFSVLAVNVGESVNDIELFTSQLDADLSFPILLDRSSQSMQSWKISGLPTTYLVDKKGRVVAGAIGGREFDHPDMVRSIRALLKP